MGLKAKIDNAILKRFDREERKRKENERTPKVYFLIICEGEKTEPSYFEGLKKGLKNFSYQKKLENMYEILQEFGSEELAILHSKRLREKYTNEKFSEHNPCTNIDLLVRELRDPLKVLKGLNE